MRSVRYDDYSTLFRIKSVCLYSFKNSVVKSTVHSMIFYKNI